MTESALILAGGGGTRIGYNKQFIEVRGKRLIEIIITELRSLFSEIILSTNIPVFYENITCLSDEIGAGPLAGIHRGLGYCKSEYLYVTACDMPFISTEYIEYMRGILPLHKPDVIVARRSDGFYEPFNAFYGKKAFSSIESAILNNRYGLNRLLDSMDLFVIEESELKNFNPNIFFNINFTEDLELLDKLL